MPARVLAAVTARLSWRAVTGLIGFWPGNSQTCGRAAFHHSRRSWSSWGDSITSRSRCPLPGSVTILRGRTRSGFSSVTVKKNRSAAMAALIVEGLALLLRHMQLKSPKIIARRRTRRPVEEGYELLHIANVVSLRVFAEPARRHVVDQALTQRADGLLGHRKLLSHMGLNPTILRQGRAFQLSLLARSLRSLAAPTARAV